MSTGTASTSSTSSGNNSQSSNRTIDNSKYYTYELPENVLKTICYYLDQNNGWEQAATAMGYALTDFIKIRQLAQSKSKTCSEQLISLWGDQNHTVTELFRVLYNVRQFTAMECMKDHVDRKYHLLLPTVQRLFNKSQETIRRSSNVSSAKILNGPEMSRENNESNYSDSMQTSKPIALDEKKIKEISSNIPPISFNDLMLATRNWHPDNILGRGGFGTVYMGHWKNTDVAIKKIKYKSDDMEKNAAVEMKQSLNELHYLNSCRHDNVLPLYGWSVDGPEPCLVYQYMPGGSLEKRLHLRRPCPLTFNQRKQIALGTARGIQYLHTYIQGKPLIHGDIKPANILLDKDSCVPKIGDFGLVREGSNESMEVSSVYGTKPYLPREFMIKKIFSVKIDTYSYGVVLFELFTALKAHDKKGRAEEFLAQYMQSLFRKNEPIVSKMDSSMGSEVDVVLFEQIMRLAVDCTHENAEIRPDMVFVLETLDALIQKNELGFIR